MDVWRTSGYLPMEAVSSQPWDSSYRWTIATFNSLSGFGSLMGKASPKDPAYTGVLIGGVERQLSICTSAWMDSIQRGKDSVPWTHQVVFLSFLFGIPFAELFGNWDPPKRPLSLAA